MHKCVGKKEDNQPVTVNNSSVTDQCIYVYDY